MTNGYRRWFADKLDQQSSGSNTLLNEQVLQGIKNAVRTYMSLYQNPNEDRITAMSFDLLDTGYSPAQIKDALEDIKNTQDRMASIAQIRDVLTVKFKPRQAENDKAYTNIMKKISNEIERFQNQKQHFLKQVGEDGFVRYVKKYVAEVYPGIVLSEFGIDTWGKIALADFYDADCDFKRAIELGSKRANKEYLERRSDEWKLKI